VSVACGSGAEQSCSGEVWTLRTVAAILANPRYTGRQVWNRQGRDHDAQRGRQQRGPVHRWNPVQDWAISKQIVHPPLVTKQDFVTAQAIRAARPTEDGATRVYLLAGLLSFGWVTPHLLRMSLGMSWMSMSRVVGRGGAWRLLGGWL
jgi:site-specific DNA recombinase